MDKDDFKADGEKPFDATAFTKKYAESAEGREIKPTILFKAVIPSRGISGPDDQIVSLKLHALVDPMQIAQLFAMAMGQVVLEVTVRVDGSPKSFPSSN